MTDHALVAAHRQASGLVPKRGADRLGLGGVVQWRARPVRHDVVDLLPLDTGVAHGPDHGLGGTVAGWVRRADVVGVPGEGATRHLCDDLGTPLRRVLGRLDDQHRGRLSEHESVAPGIERARGLLRLGVALGERSHVGECREGNRQDGRFGTAGDGDVHVAVLDEPLRLHEGLHPRGAGRDAGDHRTAQLVLDADLAGGHGGGEHRHHEGADALAALLQEDSLAVGHVADAATAGIDDDRDLVAVGVGDLEARVGDRLSGGSDGDLAESAHAPRLLEVHPGRRIEALDLRCDLDLLRGGVVGGDAGDAAHAGGQVGPEGVDVVADGRDGAHPRHDRAAPIVATHAGQVSPPSDGG